MAAAPASRRPSTPELLREVAVVALPNIGSFLLALVNEQTNVIFLGHTGGNAALAAVGLGNMMQNCIGLSIGWGLLAALDTLVSQAHGAGRQDLACAYYQRGRVIATLQLLWIVPVLCFTERILLLMGQDATVAHLAGAYNRTTAPALFCLFQFQAISKFLQNRCVAVPPMLVNLCCSVLHVGWCAFFIVRLGLGNAGAGMANAATWTLQWILISLYVIVAAPQLDLDRKQILGLTASCLQGWGQYLRVAVPALLQVSSEWWFWEICALVVGFLGTVALAAHVAALQVVSLVFMPTIGIAAAAAALVGNALGAGDPGRARRLATLCVLLNLVVWFGIAVALVACGPGIAGLYVARGEVSSLMQALMTIYAVAGFMDTTQNVMGGMLRGMGKTAVASAVYLFAYYGLMLPLGCILALRTPLGVRGIWYAMVVGTGIAVTVFSVVLARARFDRLAALASKRA